MKLKILKVKYLLGFIPWYSTEEEEIKTDGEFFELSCETIFAEETIQDFRDLTGKSKEETTRILKQYHIMGMNLVQINILIKMGHYNG